MEFVAQHPQVFISLALVLAAMAIALAWDLLKRNNEHLREMNVILEARHNEEVRRNELLMKTVALAAARTAKPVAALPAPAAAGQEIAPALDRAAEFTSNRGTRRHAPGTAVAEAPEPYPGSDDAQPGATLAEARLLARELSPSRRRGPARTRNVETPAAKEPCVATLAEARVLAREFLGRAAARQGFDAEPKPSELTIHQPEIVLGQPEHLAAAGSEPISGRKDWSKILSTTRRRPETVEVVPQPAGPGKSKGAELIPFERFQPHASNLEVPEGFHEGMMLARLLSGEDLFSGLVVSIGINDLAVRRQADELGAETLVASMIEHVRSILEPGEFACQSGPDEFVLIAPGVQSPEAQHRLSGIAEALWNFQLRSVGAGTILFSWGAFEASSQPVAAAVAGAAERMQETRRGRRTLSVAPLPQRKAV